MLVLEKIPALVIDTHIWIWEVAGDKRVEQLQNYRGRQVLSAISVWEVAMLAAKGRLKLKPDVLHLTQTRHPCFLCDHALAMTMLALATRCHSLSLLLGAGCL